MRFHIYTVQLMENKMTGSLMSYWVTLFARPIAKKMPSQNITKESSCSKKSSGQNQKTNIHLAGWKAFVGTSENMTMRTGIISGSGRSDMPTNLGPRRKN